MIQPYMLVSFFDQINTLGILKALLKGPKTINERAEETGKKPATYIQTAEKTRRPRRRGDKAWTDRIRRHTRGLAVRKDPT